MPEYNDKDIRTMAAAIAGALKYMDKEINEDKIQKLTTHQFSCFCAALIYSLSQVMQIDCKGTVAVIDMGSSNLCATANVDINRVPAFLRHAADGEAAILGQEDIYAASKN